jgi:hypothetical protein
MLKYSLIHKIKISLLLSAILVSVFSCKKSLNTAPLNAISTSQFWVDEESAKQVLIGVYTGTTGWGFTTYRGSFWMDLASDNATNVLGLNTDYCNLTNGSLSPSNPVLTNFWMGGYNKIMLANDFLENIAKMSPQSISVAARKRLTAEVRYLRAVEYFYLAQFYGDVPLVTRLLSVAEANSVTKTPKSQVEDFVTTEFVAAIQDLPSFAAITGGDRGRASKQAALGYLARLQLAQKRYADAAASYKRIMDMGENALASSFPNLFSTDKFSSENIFSLQVVSDLTLNALPAVAGGQVGINPYQGLADEFDFNDGTPFSYTDPRYNPNNIANQRDPRFAHTILYNGSTLGTYRYVSHPDSTASRDRVTASGVIQATKTGYSMRKYLPANGILISPLNNFSGSFPFIRYAEVLLGYLEAVLEAGGTIDQALLDNTINKVRGRPGVNMPPIRVTDKNLLRPILRKERRVEFALEGLRLWDLKRWGIAAQVLKGDVWGAPFPGAVSNLNNFGNLPNTKKLWYVGKLDFKPGQELWPIPATEQAINPNLR